MRCLIAHLFRSPLARQDGWLDAADHEHQRRATLASSVSQPTTANVERVAARVAEIMEEDGGCWSACSGCQESADGYVSSKDYPYSAAFKCQPGGGCRECGGIGVVWQDGAFLASYGDALFSSSGPAIGEGDRVLDWLADCDNLILFNGSASDGWWEVRRSNLKGEVRGRGPTPLDALRAAMFAVAS